MANRCAHRKKAWRNAWVGLSYSTWIVSTSGRGNTTQKRLHIILKSGIAFWNILHSQSSYGHQRENGYCHDEKCHDFSQSTRFRLLSRAVWNHFYALVLNILDAAQFEELVCGMALGYADPEQIVNRFITHGVPVEDFAVFLNNEWDLKHSFKYKKETKMSLFFI